MDLDDGGEGSSSSVKLSLKSTQLTVKGNNPPGMSDAVDFEYLVWDGSFSGRGAYNISLFSST